LITLLRTDPGLDVTVTTDDEEGVIHTAITLKPHAVVIDLQISVAGALRIARRLMREAPVPIVVVADPAHAGLAGAAEVLAAGALAVVHRPMAGRDGPAMATKLLNTLKSMAQVRVVRQRMVRQVPAAPATPRTGIAWPLEVVAIGASTGGPQALQEILTQLPATFATPVLVVQHIAPTFAENLVDWLRPQCALPIALARQDVDLSRPGIHVAPTGRHLVVQRNALALTHDPPLSGHRPSATVLFRSLAAAYGPRAVGVLLTGMGDDGAAGLQELKKAGGITIAQDEASSVVFGMPAVAIALGAADHVLAPPEIAPFLLQLATRNGRG
jgi:two-component system chemotaxis response regulator CheB